MKSKKLFKEAYIRKMLGYVIAEQMTFGRMVELLNEDIDKARDQDTELAKSEMRERAIKVFKLNCQNAPGCNPVKCKYCGRMVGSNCDLLNQFVSLLNNPKTEQI